MLNDKPKVGLALGAGAARGCAHIGVLDAIREKGIPVDFIAGTSIGSLVGAVYASGKLEALRQSLLTMDWKEILYYFVEISRPRGGFIDGKKVVGFVEEFVDETDIRNLRIPFRAVATDIHDGSSVVMEDGPLLAAIRASIAIPGVFTPVVREDRVLVDGGLVNPVPVDVVRDMGAEFIIAVDINQNRVSAECGAARKGPDSLPAKPPDPVEAADWSAKVKHAMQSKLDAWDHKIRDQVKRWSRSGPVPSIVDVLGNTVRIIEAQLSTTTLRITKPDVIIQPDVGDMSFLEFNKAREAIDAGYEAAKRELDRVGARWEH
jgi:NTE family protein